MSDPFKVKMMPGQEPYTKDELVRLYALVDEAARAEEVLTDEEKRDIEWEVELRKETRHE